MVKAQNTAGDVGKPQAVLQRRPAREASAVHTRLSLHAYRARRERNLRDSASQKASSATLHTSQRKKRSSVFLERLK